MEYVDIHADTLDEREENISGQQSVESASQYGKMTVRLVPFSQPSLPKSDQGLQLSTDLDEELFGNANSLEMGQALSELSLPNWTDLQQPGESKLLNVAAQRLHDEADSLRVCLLGGKFRKDTDDEQRLVPVLQAISRAFESRPDLDIHLVTGGLDGVQRSYSALIGESYRPKLLHLASREGLESSIDSSMEHGRHVQVCDKKVEKATVMANIGSIYLMVSGGPGVAAEAMQALDRGAVVLPLMFTGGASSFKYKEFPEMKRPKYASKKQWEALKVGPPEQAAEAIVEIVAAMVGKRKKG